MARGHRKGTAFHKSDQKYLEDTAKLIERRAGDGTITPEDARLVKAFLAEIGAETGISPVRKYKIAIQVIGLRRFLPPFKEADALDLYNAIEEIRVSKKDDGTLRFAVNTRSDMVRFMKRFYLWMIENGYSTIPEAKVQKIRPPAYERMTKTAEELLDEDEVKAMIEASRTPRDRALISVLYESGCRIGELAALTWSDVKFTEGLTAAINTDGKTGKQRYIPLVSARSYLAEWKANYPGDPVGGNLVFLTTTTHRPLQYAGVAVQIRRIAARAGIEKHITPHLFRHSRITHLLRKGVPEPVIKRMMWGHLSTDMLQTYGHLVDRDVDAAIAQLYGIKTPEAETSDALEPRQCSRCFQVWGPTLSHCGNCGAPLSPQARADFDDVLAELQNLIRNDPVRAMQAVQEMQRGGDD